MVIQDQDRHNIIWTLLANSYTHKRTHTHMHINTYLHTHAYKYMYTHMYIYTHKYVHIEIRQPIEDPSKKDWVHNLSLEDPKSK